MKTLRTPDDVAGTGAEVLLDATADATARKVAQALLDIGAVGFTIDKPITFVSGIKAPLYVDNRKFPFNPDAWRVIIEAFKEKIEQLPHRPEVVAGVEAAGIPHSAALGFLTHTPSVFVRKKPKEHGTKKRIEGGSVEGKRVLLIEDLVTRGGSSLNAVAALRAEGAIVSDVIVIMTYGFPESLAAFKSAGVGLHPLMSLPILMEEAVARQMLSERDAKEISRWAADPHHWQGPAR